MSSYAYIIHSSNGDDSVARKMVNSLVTHNRCTVLFNHVGHQTYFISDLSSICEKNQCTLLPFMVEQKDWSGNRMGCKIHRLLEMPFKDGDLVFVLDTDLLIQDDIFRAFGPSSDVLVTKRHYEYWYVINAGVWGFKFSQKTREFLKYFSDQIKNPTWEPLTMFRNRFGGRSGADWWVDQDFLCTIMENGMPEHLKGCNLHDIGPKYNFCPSVEEDKPETYEKAKKEILSAVGNPDYSVLHFKGRLKGVMP